MNLAALSLPVVVAALALAAAWLVAAALLPLWIRAARRSPIVARGALLVAALPWLAGVALVVAALLPGDPHTGLTLGCHCLASMPTWLHLCPVHPDEAAALVAPSVVVLALLLPGRLRALRLLWVEPLGRGGGDAPHLVDLGTPAAVLHGWLRPTLVVDRGLWRALAPAERQALLAHERGHLARRDPLVRMVLRGLWTVAPAPLAQGAVRAWLDHAERAADAEAGRIVGDPTLVAGAILRCARLGAAGPDLALGWSGGSLADRVHALLEGPAPRSPARPDAGPADLLALALALLLGLSASPWLHHQVEHLLNLSL